MHQINNNNSTINRLHIKGILQEFSSWNSAVPESGKTVEGKSETDTISTRAEFYFRAHANNQHQGQVIYIKKKKKKATAVQWIELQTVDKGLKNFLKTLLTWHPLEKQVEIINIQHAICNTDKINGSEIIAMLHKPTSLAKAS